MPLLLYTGDATDAAVEAHRATRTRADDYLRKPFDMAELLGRAAALLHGDGAVRAAAPDAALPPAPPRPDGRRPAADARRRPRCSRASTRPGRLARARRRLAGRLDAARRAAAARRPVPRPCLPRPRRRPSARARRRRSDA